jgi:uncharacterized protein YbaP (TraB family)
MGLMFARRVAAMLGALAFTALARPAVAEPALWRVQGPHATIYLFGTVHVLKPSTQWRTPKIDQAFKSSTSLYEEITDADDPSAAQPLLLKYGLDPAHPLTTKLDDAAKAELATVGGSLGLLPSQLEPMRPWLASLMISVLPVVKAGYDPKSGVDNVLKADAAAMGKPLLAFETLEQQVRFFADLPQKQEVDYLMSTLDDAAKGAAELDELVDSWASGDTKRLEELMNGDLTSKYPTLYKILLVDRNKAFAAQVETLLKGEGTIFVAIGAGHLVGPDSVQADLARDGIKAVRQ